MTLRMKGGDFSISGELKAFDNEKYTILSKSFGIMSLDATRFECEGSACPKGAAPPVAPVNLVPGAPQSKVVLSGSDTIGSQLMPALIQAYAQSSGAKATRIAGSDPLDLQIKLTDANGRDLGTVEVSHHGSASGFKDLEQRKAAVAMATPGGLITPDLLSPALAATAAPPDGLSRVRRRKTLGAAVEDLEREMIEAALERAAGNISETARTLGLTRRGLYLKMQRLGVSGLRAEV